MKPDGDTTMIMIFPALMSFLSCSEQRHQSQNVVLLVFLVHDSLCRFSLPAGRTRMMTTIIRVGGILAHDLMENINMKRSPI